MIKISGILKQRTQINILKIDLDTVVQISVIDKKMKR